MTLAAETREAVRGHPFLYDALRAGVVNYTAAARFLDVEGDTDAVVAALRRYVADLPDYDAGEGVAVPGDASGSDSRGGEVRVRMESGFGRGDPADALVVVGDTALTPGSGSMTAVVARGDVGAGALRAVLGRLETADVAVETAAGTGGAVVAVVGRRDGPDAVRAVEDALGD